MKRASGDLPRLIPIPGRPYTADDADRTEHLRDTSTIRMPCRRCHGPGLDLTLPESTGSGFQKIQMRRRCGHFRSSPGRLLDIDAQVERGNVLEELDMNRAASRDTSLDIKVTKRNRRKLDSLLAGHAGAWSWRATEYLLQELTHSTVLDEAEIPANIVTMRSRVEFRADGIGVHQVATLVYPGENGFYDDAISVLTPVGAALIGLTEGQSISYAAPDGRPKSISVMRILYQPEASRRMPQP